MSLLVNPPASAVIWSLPNLGKPLLRWWDGEEQGVTYNPASGDTHLIEMLAFELLELLGDSSSSLEQIAARMAGRFEAVADPARIGEHIESTLLQLQDAGLVISSAA